MTDTYLFKVIILRLEWRKNIHFFNFPVIYSCDKRQQKLWKQVHGENVKNVYLSSDLRRAKAAASLESAEFSWQCLCTINVFTSFSF